MAPGNGAAIVCWRAGRSRGPWVSNGSRSPICASSSCGERIALRAAASSMARGNPSSRRQSEATAAALRSSSAKLGRTSRVRATSRRTAALPSRVARDG